MYITFHSIPNQLFNPTFFSRYIPFIHNHHLSPIANNLEQSLVVAEI